MRYISLLCISLLIFIFSSEVILNPDVIGAAVNIPDANLESALRLQLGIPSDLLTDSDLVSVTHLSVIHTEIANLEGLEHCRNLVHLSLIGVKVKDIRPIKKLTNLHWLDLGNNQVSDIRPIAALTNLRWLDLNNNQIRDIESLAGLINLERLDLNNNQIRDIQPLAELIHYNGPQYSGQELSKI